MVHLLQTSYEYILKGTRQGTPLSILVLLVINERFIVFLRLPYGFSALSDFS